MEFQPRLHRRFDGRRASNRPHGTVLELEQCRRRVLDLNSVPKGRHMPED